MLQGQTGESTGTGERQAGESTGTGLAAPVPHREPLLPQTEESKGRKWRVVLIASVVILLLLSALGGAGFLLKKLISKKYFFCSGSVKFIPRAAALRLVSNRSVLQVYSAGSGWRTVCAEDWSQQDTETACMQLGYTLNPHSERIPVQTLSPALSQFFSAVQSGRITTTPIHRAVTDRQKELSSWQVVSGHTHLSVSEGMSIERIILNGLFNPTRIDYDIAMVQLSQPITAGASQLPVCLPPHDLELRDGEPLVVTGWGLLKEGGTGSPVLQMATVPLIDRNVCSTPTVYGYVITPRMLCAGYLKGQVDACNGDSGGPLVHCPGRCWQVGVVSWGLGCARRNKPGVYCSVGQLLNWIHTVIKDQSSVAVPHLQDQSSVAVPHLQDQSSVPVPHLQDQSSVPVPHLQDQSSVPVPHLQDQSSVAVPHLQDQSSVAVPHLQDRSSVAVPHLQDQSSVPVPHLQDQSSKWKQVWVMQV
ncbi:hypothetical protein JZ751_017247 [Albula glossodonta]|uniref:Uncharacterized protein n=1 Tax=Albula glossodonta TaxID=121402 RepID=A0A8T2MUN4_9TELE|nr:hypothetical protein JZ751_017247 [Albula glossodonta]